MNDPLRLLILGAHPDDGEFHAGGLIAQYRAAGHEVKIVSATDGSAGHHELSSEQLIATRREEARAVERLTGVTYEIWPFRDGYLERTIELRERVIRAIRSFHPDLVITHRPSDYHPDHRAIGQAVQDASYLVTVPLIVPDVPALRRDPVVAYMVDFFVRPAPFVADVIFDVADQFDAIIDMLDCHASQVYQWLPYNMGLLSEVPADPDARKEMLRQRFEQRLRQIADRYRDALKQQLGTDEGAAVELAEAYEISEYAAPLDAHARQRLFWFACS